MRILFMGGHELGKITLKHLLNQNKDIVGVVMPDSDSNWYQGVDEIAKEHNIPLYKEENINRADFVSKVKEIDPDLITVVNFPQILEKEIINIPDYGCINTHASLLPKYRGRAPLNWAIINGEEETGVTVHYIDQGIDTGNIILQKKIKIETNDYIKDVLNKIKGIYPKIVNEAIELIINNQIESLPQDSAKGFYCERRTPKDGQINWNKSAKDIYNLIRAVSHPYPGAYSYVNNKKLLIWQASIVKGKKNYIETELGEIVDIKDKGYLVKANNGLILLESIEFEDESEDIEIGDVLEYKEEG